MEESDKELIRLYKSGLSIYKIAERTGRKRETIRLFLKKSGVKMRNLKNISYTDISNLSQIQILYLSELFGYFLGDGSVSFRNGRYDCCLTFTIHEKDLLKRVDMISKALFKSTPRVVNYDGYFCLIFSSSIGRYLHSNGYPIGKKSVKNPRFPDWILNGDRTIKSAALIGFFNAEASLNDKRLKVQQSVRYPHISNSIDILKKNSERVKIKGKYYYFLKWGKVEHDLIEIKSNLLKDVKRLLREFGINSSIIPVRIHINPHDRISVHFELYVSRKDTKRLIGLGLITNEKKLHTYNAGVS